MVSTDTVAAISLISFEKDPMLYSIVLGEGVINDAVSIILFATVLKVTTGEDMKFSTGGEKINAASVFMILQNFIKLGFVSLVIGFAFGLLSAYILKRFRLLSARPIVETTLVFGFAYLSYCVSELTHNSGIISILTTGIVMAHYTWYNLSPIGKQASFSVS